MNLFLIFGIGADVILKKNCHITGTVTNVQNSSLYVVKKPVRFGVNQQNTLFSHWITFTYAVNGISYKGKRWISLRHRCPQKGDRIDVYYDPEKPKNYACQAFGPAGRPIGW